MGKQRSRKPHQSELLNHGPPQSVNKSTINSTDMSTTLIGGSVELPIRQGDYFNPYTEARVNTYQLVDSWRSHRDDTHLQALANIWSGLPSDASSLHALPPHRPPVHNFNPNAPLFQPSQVYYAPTPSRTVLYHHRRVPGGDRERLFVERAQKSMASASAAAPPSRPSLGLKRPDQSRPYSSRADTMFPSIEAEESPRNGRPPQRQVLVRKVETSGHSTPQRVVASPPAPNATPEYKNKAQLPPALRSMPQKLLVVLDLNGTMLVRPRKSEPTKFKTRPGLVPFLDYLFTHHVVMVYTSTKPWNAEAMLDRLIHPTHRPKLVAVWARDKLGLTKEQYDNKVQVYKNLEMIWSDASIQAAASPGCQWGQGNTVLVDDSQVKALAQPHNLLQVAEFRNDAPGQGGQAFRQWQRAEEEILNSLQAKLEKLKWQVDVSRQIRKWQIEERASGVVDERVDQDHGQEEGSVELEKKVGHGEQSTDDGGRQCPTPLSPRRSVSPIDEIVFTEILRVDENEPKGPPTPDSPAI